MTYKKILLNVPDGLLSEEPKEPTLSAIEVPWDTTTDILLEVLLEMKAERELAEREKTNSTARSGTDNVSGT